MPPSRISSTSVLVITARPAIAPPIPSEPVSPMKMLAGKLLNHRKPMHAPTRQAASSVRSCCAVRDERDPDVGEQDDRGAAGGEAVEPVGEVDGARRAGDDEVDQDRVQRPEVDAGVDEPEADRLGARRAFWVATHHSPSEIAIVTSELGPRAQPERAALDDLRVVVGEAEQQRTRRVAPKHPDRLPVASRTGSGTGPRTRSR